MEKLANASPSTSSKKDLGVVTPLVPDEIGRTSFFHRVASFFAHVSLLFLSGASESFCIFFCIYLFLLIPSRYNGIVGEA